MPFLTALTPTVILKKLVRRIHRQWMLFPQEPFYLAVGQNDQIFCRSDNFELQEEAAADAR